MLIVRSRARESRLPRSFRVGGSHTTPLPFLGVRLPRKISPPPPRFRISEHVSPLNAAESRDPAIKLGFTQLMQCRVCSIV